MASSCRRLRHLQQAPAGIRFLSIEPLIGRIGKLDLSGIDWVIVGGESGPGARIWTPIGSAKFAINVWLPVSHSSSSNGAVYAPSPAGECLINANGVSSQSALRLPLPNKSIGGRYD